jgi:hypothetical protein
MANLIRRMPDPSEAGSRDWRLSKAFPKDELRESSFCEASADDRATLDEGLRLNRAFFTIRHASIRKAIINLIIETADKEDADEPRFPPLI